MTDKRIIRLRTDNKHWRELAEQGIEIERKLRAEIEQLRAKLAEKEKPPSEGTPGGKG